MEILLLLQFSDSTFDLKKQILQVTSKTDISEGVFVYNSSKQFLEQLYLKKSFLSWKENSVEFVKFHALIQTSPPTAAKFLDIILEILAQTVQLEHDFMIRFSSLQSLSKIMTELSPEKVLPFGQMILQ